MEIETVLSFIALACFVLALFIVFVARISAYFSVKKKTKSAIPPNVTIRVNGNECDIPIPSTNVLKTWIDSKKENEANPQSCECEPEEDEVLVPSSFFSPGNNLAGWDKYEHYRSLYSRASWCGYNNIAVKKSDYEEALAFQAEARQREEMLSTTVTLNNYGIELEKRGEIDGAIATYEENIKLRYPAHHSYKRLMVLYRKRKDKENEKRIINIALEVFPEYEEYRVRLKRLTANE